MRQLWAIVFLVGLFGSAQAHVVEQIYSEFRAEEDGKWELEVLFDAGYADPVLRGDEDSPAPSRDWLVGKSEDEWAAMREEAGNYLEGMLDWSEGGWEAREFPDFAVSPPDFPVLLNGGAYFRIIYRGEGGVHLSVGEEHPDLVVRVEDDYLVLKAEDGRWIRKPGRGEAIWMWVRQGFLHVVPKGLDHLLFILALFCYRREWRPLVGQSLAFTAAHALTMALVAVGVVNLPGRLVEVLIAASLVFVGLENLGGRKQLKWRVLVVFTLGLLHGMGFAGALGRWMGEGERLVPSVAWMNLGVELAQVAVLVVLWVLTMGWTEKAVFEKFRKGASLLVALAGAYWVVERIAG